MMVTEETDLCGSVVCQVSQSSRTKGGIGHTESDRPHTQRRRRLRVVWNENAPQTTGDGIPDSHDARLRRVREGVQRERLLERHRAVHVAAESIRLLATRVDPTSVGEIPREIRRHQWSALNVPLLWAAAEGDANNPMVRWLVGAAERVPRVVVAGVDMSGADAAVIGLGIVARCFACKRSEVSRGSG